MNNTLKITLAGAAGLALGLMMGLYAKRTVNQEEKKAAAATKNPTEEEDSPFKHNSSPKQQQAEADGKAVEETVEQSQEAALKAVPAPLEEQQERKPPLPIKDDSFPLGYGSSGERVVRLQIHLMRQLGWVRKPTGVWDETTLSRVKKHFKTTTVSQQTYHDLKLGEMVHDQHKKRENE